jgi:hypothetical protein
MYDDERKKRERQAGLREVEIFIEDNDRARVVFLTNGGALIGNIGTLFLNDKENFVEIVDCVYSGWNSTQSFSRFKLMTSQIIGFSLIE